MRGWCDKCGKYMREVGTDCSCQSWRVWSEDLGDGPDDARVIHAVDGDAAARRWAEITDIEGADYPISGGCSKRIWVSSGPVDYQFEVSGKVAIKYSTELVAMRRREV